MASVGTESKAAALTPERAAAANKLKDDGNKAFSVNDFKGAVSKFSAALEIDPSNEVFYSNRCAAYLNLKDHASYEKALVDAQKCVELKPEWGKGYARLGAAYVQLGKFEEAMTAITTGIAKEPKNPLLAEGLVNAQKAQKLAEEAEVKANDHVIGIDLGTTYCAVGVWKGDKVVMIPNDRGSLTTPSWVAFTSTGKRLVGQAAKAQVAGNPKNTIYDVKRFIGQRFSDAGVSTDVSHYAYTVKPNSDDKPMIEVDLGMHGKKQYAAEEISAMVLAYLKKISEDYLKVPVTKAVITVPAYFNDSQRAATKAAGRIAGLDVLRIINEPTAAALSYGLDLKMSKKGKKNVMIFDLGGGTFDVSLLQIESGVFEVKSTGGDTRLGGEDFDLSVAKFLVKEAATSGVPDFSEDQRAMKRLGQAVEAAKRELSSGQVANILVENIVEQKDEAGKKKAYDFKYTLDRKQFEKLNESFFVRCLDTVKRVLKDGKTKPEEVDDIVLVGGSTRIPKMQEMLQQFFNGRDLCRALNPDEAVAFGAAVQGAILNGKRNKQTENLLLRDVTPLSLGIETVGNVMSVIIPRNTPIPVSKTQTYSTTENFQTSVDVVVFEGERMKSDENHELGQFTINGIERAKKGEAKVDVTFSIDSNGMLLVEAVDQKTGARAEITIAGQNRASDSDIERMMKDAETFRKEDEARVKKMESINELETLLNDISELMLSDPTADVAELDKLQSETMQWLDDHREEASAGEVALKKRAVSSAITRFQRQQDSNMSNKNGRRRRA